MTRSERPGIDRRNFLRNAAMTGAATLLAP